MRRKLCWIAWVAVVAAGAGRVTAGCPPLAGGTDSFPSTAKFVIDDAGFGQPFVVRLSSAGHPDASLARGPQVADTIDLELLQLELSGFHPRIGPVVVRQSPVEPSLGEIRDVELDGSCQFAGGESVLDLFVEIELADLGETWVHADPIRVEAALDALPPEDAAYEVPRVVPVALEDQATAESRGELLYLLHRPDPAFPPAGADCLEELLTADLYLSGPDATANLIGFGPATVLRDAPVPGGFCATGGAPCDSDLDCPLFNCVRDSVNVEIVELGLAGFDVLLGDWQMEVRPDTGTSDCCESHPEPGCSDPVCEAFICNQDPFCCTDGWDPLCAALAEGAPECADNCIDPHAAPSTGKVRSVQLDRTYPATSTFDLYVRIHSDLQGTLRNDAPISLQPPELITNLPPDPGTEYRYTGTPVPVVDEEGAPAGEISNVVDTLQPPLDCQPPPAANDDCLEMRLQVELTLPPCPTEPVSLDGQLRLLRDDPVDGVGLGQEVIDALLARGDFSGTASCAGPLTLRRSHASASGGTVASLAPEEFFPADSFFDVYVELETPAGTLTGGPSRMTTSVNALPPDPGEVYWGPATAIDLLDGTQAEVGELLEVAHEIVATVACPADYHAAIRFPGPTGDDLDVGIPQGGGGVDYDVARGDLLALRASGGSFASASCLRTDVGPAVTDGDTPALGAGFYYVARDGLAAYNGTWNGPGSFQQADRDPLLPSCP